MKLRIAVISDLHCHPKDTTSPSSYLLSDGPRTPRSQHPVESLLGLIETAGLKTDILALPGDFTDRANHQGFVVGLFCAREIAQKLGATSVVASMGNHDVDSRQTYSKDHLFIGRCLFTDFPTSNSRERERFYTSGFAFHEGEFWRCTVLNSVHDHRDAETAKRGLLTANQLEDLDRALMSMEQKPLQFCVVHHHPIAHENLGLGAHDLMEGGEQLLTILESYGFSLLVHGHKHHPRLRYSNTGRSGLPIFASGSLSAVITNRLARSTRNTFHVIDLFAADENNTRPHGIIHSWEYSGEEGWGPSTYRSSGISHRTGFGAQQPISDLKSQLLTLLGQQKWLAWEEVCAQIPAFQFVTPAELRELAQQLQPHRVRLSELAEEPQLVGKLS